MKAQVLYVLFTKNFQVNLQNK